MFYVHIQGISKVLERFTLESLDSATARSVTIQK